jgi:cobalamin biosynthesis Co2+ chelatase CbiK/NAD-dependent dihydropyrimidine dehydrogenase PreA subunit
MAYRISEECAACGACEPECPNQAISEGTEIYVIDPQKCTECLGFYDSPRCARVCPVNAPVPDPTRRESDRDLLARFQKLHPGLEPKGFVLRTENDRPVIALVADGSGDAEGQAALEELDDHIRRQFPDYDVVWAVQASYMIQGLKYKGQTTQFKRAVPLMLADDLLKRLAAAGRTKVAMQLFMSGESNFSKNAIKADTLGMDVKYGLPFLAAAHPENELKLIKSLGSLFAGDGKTATVLVGHGSEKDFEYNEWFINIDKYLREHYKNVFLGTIHGPPGTDFVASVQASGCDKVRFVSLMMSRGGHMPLDIVNDTNPESWSRQVGLPAEPVDSFSTNPALREYFVSSIRALLGQFKS